MIFGMVGSLRKLTIRGCKDGAAEAMGSRRRAAGSDRAVTAGRASGPADACGIRLAGFPGHPVRSAHRESPEKSSTRIWLRLGHDLPASAGRVGRGRLMVPAARNLLAELRGANAPLAATSTGGDPRDVTQLIPLLQAVPRVRGKRGRHRRRPAMVLADRGYDHDKYRRLVRDPGVKLPTAGRGIAHGSGLAPSGGSCNARSLTCTGFGGCGSAGRYATTSTKPS